MKTIRFKLTFIDQILATTPGNEEIYSDYIASKAFDIKTKVEDSKDEKQVAAAKKEARENTDEEKEMLHNMLDSMEEIEKGTTFFFKDENGNPYIYSYWLYGFFKSACSALKKVPGTLSSKIKAYKKERVGYVRATTQSADHARRASSTITIRERTARNHYRV